MFKYIVKRILSSLLVLLGVVTITFFIARVIPSSPQTKWAGQRATPEQLEAARIELGLDKSLPEQYVIYLNDLIHGDLGNSLNSHQPVSTELKRYVPATLELVLVAFVLAVAMGIPLGIYSAKKKDKMLDHCSRFFSIGAVSLPTFWVALFLQLIFYKTLQWLPIGGRLSVEATIFDTVPNISGMLLLDCLLTGKFALFGDALRHIILPCITIALYPIGLVARMTRSALLEILGEDYITAGHSYGLSGTKRSEKQLGHHGNGRSAVYGLYLDEYVPCGGNFLLAGHRQLHFQRRDHFGLPCHRRRYPVRRRVLYHSESGGGYCHRHGPPRPSVRRGTA